MINIGESYYFYCKKNNLFEVYQLKSYSISKLYSEKEKIIGYDPFNGGIYFYSESKKYKHNHLGKLVSTEEGSFYDKRKEDEGSFEIEEFYDVEEIPEKMVWSEIYTDKGKKGMYYYHKKWDYKTKRKIVEVDTIPPVYDSVVTQSFFNTNYKYSKFKALKNGKWGVIDIYNHETIPFKFDSIQLFRNRVCYLFLNNKMGAVKITNDKYPSHLLDVKYDSIQLMDATINSNFIVTLNGERFYVFRDNPRLEIPIKDYKVLGRNYTAGFKLITVLTKSGKKAFIGENGTYFFEE